MKPFARIAWSIAADLACLLVGWRTGAADATSTARPGGFQFDGKISRQVLENYLSRSICIEGMLNGRGPLADDIRMLTNCGAKYVASALCLWGAENNFLANIKRAKEEAPQVLAADPEIVLEGCVFEIVGPRVSQIAIPDWVFKDLGQPVEQRNFRYEDMIYPAGQRRQMGSGQVPDESRLETQLWFYYQAASYIDVGCAGIHFGQVEIMNRNDHGNTNWFHLISLVREYAARHARRHMVLCNGHVPTGGLMHRGNPHPRFPRVPIAHQGDSGEAAGSHSANRFHRCHLRPQQRWRNKQRLDVRAPALHRGARQLRTKPPSRRAQRKRRIPVGLGLR